MDPRFVMAATGIALIVGVISWWVPVQKYRTGPAVGTFGMILLGVGFLLMTMFKWGDIVIEVQGLKVQLAEARQETENLRQEVAVKNAALKSIQDQIQFAGAERQVDYVT